MVSLGFHTTHYSPMFGGTSSAVDVIRASASAGFTHVGLDLASIEAHVASGGRVEELADVLNESRLSCSDIVGYFPTPDQGMRESAIYVSRIATLLGAPLVVISSSSTVAWSEVRQQCAEASRIFASDGRRSAVEFIPHRDISNLDMAIELCDLAGWDRAGLVIDSFHFFMGHTSIERLQTLERDHIALVQYSDARTLEPVDRADESRNQRVLPGDGCLPLPDFTKAILGLGYEGVVSAEVLSSVLREREPFDVAITCHRTMMRDWPVAR